MRHSEQGARFVWPLWARASFCRERSATTEKDTLRDKRTQLFRPGLTDIRKQSTVVSILDDKYIGDSNIIRQPDAINGDEDEDIWKLLNEAPTTKCALMICNLTCTICQYTYGLDDKCPICGEAVSAPYVCVTKCGCGALLALCKGSLDGRPLVCGVSIPLVKEAEDTI